MFPTAHPQPARQLTNRRRWRLEALEDRAVPAAGGTVSGTVFNDQNSNGVFDASPPGFGHVHEPFLQGVRVFADQNGNGRFDTGEISSVSDAGGGFRLDFAADGVYTLVAETPLGAKPTSPNPIAVTVAGGSQLFVDFGFHEAINPLGDQELIAVGAGQGGGPQVKVHNADASLRFSFYAYDPSFAGGVRVATGDVDGDGVEDIVTAPGPGGGPHVKVYSGRTGGLIAQFMAYDPAFTGGVNVAAGDVNGDGLADIVTGAGPGGGPHVKAFDGARLVTGAGPDGTPPLIGGGGAEFMAYDPAFRGGVSVAVGRIGPFGEPAIITGAGQGGGPHVKAFDAATGAVRLSFMAYDPAFRGGVSVASGNTGLSGVDAADIITGAGAGGGPHVKVFSGKDGSVLRSFYAFDPGFTGGVRVAVTEVNGDGHWDLLLGAGPGGGPHVKALDAATLEEMAGLYAFDPAFTGGVFVG